MTLRDPDRGFEPMILQHRGEQANKYMTDVVFKLLQVV
jgi:hypothetical protein